MHGDGEMRSERARVGAELNLNFHTPFETKVSGERALAAIFCESATDSRIRPNHMTPSPATTSGMRFAAGVAMEWQYAGQNIMG